MLQIELESQGYRRSIETLTRWML